MQCQRKELLVKRNTCGLFVGSEGNKKRKQLRLFHDALVDFAERRGI